MLPVAAASNRGDRDCDIENSTRCEAISVPSRPLPQVKPVNGCIARSLSEPREKIFLSSLALSEICRALLKPTRWIDSSCLPGSGVNEARLAPLWSFGPRQPSQPASQPSPAGSCVALSPLLPLGPWTGAGGQGRGAAGTTLRPTERGRRRETGDADAEVRKALTGTANNHKDHNILSPSVERSSRRRSSFLSFTLYGLPIQPDVLGLFFPRTGRFRISIHRQHSCLADTLDSIDRRVVASPPQSRPSGRQYLS